MEQEMAEKREYRSAIRSRKLIRKAFMEILKEKNLEKVTVTDIVKRADINRSTFYAHYPDVLGVVEEIHAELLCYFEEYLATIDFSNFFEDPKKHLLIIVKIAEENEELYRMLAKSNTALKQMENLKKILVTKILTGMDVPEMYKGSFGFEFSVRFFIGGFIDIYTKWLEGEVDCSLEEMIEELSKLMLCAYEAYQPKRV